MANCNRQKRQRGAAEETEARLRSAVQALSEAAEAACPMEEEVPMSRYSNPLPVCCAPGRSCGAREQTALLEQLLEQTCRQNQILLDLLGAVNSLTAAALSLRGN